MSEQDIRDRSIDELKIRKRGGLEAGRRLEVLRDRSDISPTNNLQTDAPSLATDVAAVSERGEKECEISCETQPVRSKNAELKYNSPKEQESSSKQRSGTLSLI